MSSIKIVLRQKALSDGTFPLAIRITKDRKASFITLGYGVNKKDWDVKSQSVKKSHPNSARLNHMIAKRLAEVTDKRLELESHNTDTSSRAIRKAFKGSKEGTFFQQAALYLTQLEAAGKFNRLSSDKYRIERFKEFVGQCDIQFSEITPTLLKRFQVYLKSTRSVSERTIVNHLIVIRTLFNEAIAAKLVDRKYYPFGKGNIVIKFPDSLKIGLTAEEVTAIEKAEVADAANHARNLWLFSFYFAGMRISDVLRLRWSDFQNDRLFYRMGKNAKGGSLKVPEKALNILHHYRRPHPKHDLVFPDLESVADLADDLRVQATIKMRVKTNNKHLQTVLEKAMVTKTVTMHIARHTFGNLSGDKIPLQMLQKLYRHTSITTTMGYQANFIHKDADDALNAVIGF